jgi:hypothetical protein
MSVDSSEHDALGQHGLYAGKAPNGRNTFSPFDRQLHLHVTQPLHNNPPNTMDASTSRPALVESPYLRSLLVRPP